jgi:hypothetical protein
MPGRWARGGGNGRSNRDSSSAATTASVASTRYTSMNGARPPRSASRANAGPANAATIPPEITSDMTRAWCSMLTASGRGKTIELRERLVAAGQHVGQREPQEALAPQRQRRYQPRCNTDERAQHEAGTPGQKRCMNKEAGTISAAPVTMPSATGSVASALLSASSNATSAEVATRAMAAVCASIWAAISSQTSLANHRHVPGRSSSVFEHLVPGLDEEWCEQQRDQRHEANEEHGLHRAEHAEHRDADQEEHRQPRLRLERQTEGGEDCGGRTGEIQRKHRPTPQVLGNRDGQQRADEAAEIETSWWPASSSALSATVSPFAEATALGRRAGQATVATTGMKALQLHQVSSATSAIRNVPDSVARCAVPG